MKTQREIDAMLIIKDDYVVDPANPHLGGNHYHNKTTFWPELGHWIIDKFCPDSVLDVGCGEGRAMQFFWEFGPIGSNILGIDGHAWNAHTCSQPVIIHDFRNGAVVVSNIQLVWCVELVEHVEERYVDNVLLTLANGDIICMTHGLPGQGGYHHVNCQPPSYWINKMRGIGYALDEAATAESKTKVPKGSHWSDSGMIFKKAN